MRGSLLGIFEQAEYMQQTIQLQPGDKLLLYSDGAEPFIGKFDDKGRFNFGDDFHKIRDLSIVEIVSALDARVQSQELEPVEVDDITLVGLEIRANAPAL